MIDFSTLKFGDKVYLVASKLRAFQRRKITTVIDGVEWFRYDQPIREYEIVEHTYVGRADTQISGDVIPEDLDETKYFVRCEPSGEMAYLHDRDTDNDDWFASKEEAEKEVNERIEDDKRIDRS